MGQINTNNYPTVSSLADADLLIVENAVHGTGTTTPKQLRENAIGTDALKTTAQTVTGAINEILEMAETLHGLGKVTSVTGGVVDTDIDLGRAPKVGDRILVLFDSSVTTVSAIKTYNGSTAIQTDWEYAPVLDFHLNGVCIIEFIADPFSPDPTIICARLVRMFEGTVYTAGTGISLSNNKITNTLPQMGVNIDGGKINSVSSGNLGFYSKASTFVVMVFNCDAVPYNGEYHLNLTSSSGAVVIMYDAVLVDPVTGGRYSRNIKKYTTLICEVTNSGSGSESDPILVNVVGEITNDLADKVDAVLDAISEEKTVSGNPIVITDALALPAKSLKTTIEAIQDLHGYDHPWAGGAYKNLLPLVLSTIKSINIDGTWNDNVYTINGSTIEVIVDNDNNIKGFKANGTFNANTRFVFTTNSGIGSGSYKLNGCPSGGSDSTYRIFVGYYQTEGGTLYGSADLGSGRTYNNIYSIVDARIDIMANTTLSNVMFYPMIRLAAEPDPTFAPWENKCPISGRTAVVVNRSDGDEISEDFTIQLGTTVYGADINWDTGVATLKTTKMVIDGNSNIFLDSGTVGNTAMMRLNITPQAKAYGDFDIRNMKASYLTPTSSNDLFNRDELGVTTNTAGAAVWFRLPNIKTVADAKTYLTSNPLQVEYELATPTTLQLTPTQLQMLKGYNRVSIENGAITLTYKADRLAAIEAALAAL